MLPENRRGAVSLPKLHQRIAGLLVHIAQFYPVGGRRAARYPHFIDTSLEIRPTLITGNGDRVSISPDGKIIGAVARI